MSLMKNIVFIAVATSIKLPIFPLIEDVNHEKNYLPRLRLYGLTYGV